MPLPKRYQKEDRIRFVWEENKLSEIVGFWGGSGGEKGVKKTNNVVLLSKIVMNSEKLQRIMAIYLQQQQIFQSLLNEILNEDDEIDDD